MLHRLIIYPQVQYLFFYYNIKFDYDGLAFNLMKDPKSNPTGADSLVADSVYNQAQGIRDYVLQQKVQMNHPSDLLELLYNNANRLLTSNNLTTFLNTFSKKFHNWLYRLILRKHDLFSSANTTMVASIQSLYDNNTIDLGYSNAYKNRYFPLVNDEYDDTSSYFLWSSSSVNIDHEIKAVKLNETSGFVVNSLTNLTSSDNMLEGIQRLFGLNK